MEYVCKVFNLSLHPQLNGLTFKKQIESISTYNAAPAMYKHNYYICEATTFDFSQQLL